MSLESTADELRERADELRLARRGGHHVPQGELADHLDAIADELDDAVTAGAAPTG